MKQKYTSLSCFQNLDCVYATLGGGLLVFLTFSIWLAPYNFDLHHDGYVLTQSWLGRIEGSNGEQPFQQYGILFHYILGLLLDIDGGSPLLSRYFGIALIACSSLIFFAAIKTSRLSVGLSLTIWLSQCYWATQHLQFFVQFHPSQLGLLCFSINFFLIQHLSDQVRKAGLQVLLMILVCVVCIFVKINFGILLLSATTIALLVKRPKNVFWFCLITSLVLASVSIGVVAIELASIREAFSFDVNAGHLRHVGLIEGIRNTFWLNTDHGSVHLTYRILFILPAVFVVWTIFSFFKATVGRGMPAILIEFVSSNDNRILAIMALALWCTIFPTGSFQHIWYGCPLAMIFAARFISSFLRSSVLWIVTSIVVFVAFQNLVEVGASKVVRTSSFEAAGFGLLKEIKVSPSVLNYLKKIEEINTVGSIYARSDNVCKTLNLTVNGIFVRNPESFCSVDSGLRNFTWHSEMHLPYKEFENRISSWRGGVVSPTPDLVAALEFVSHNRVYGQDFGVDNFFFISHAGIPKSPQQKTGESRFENGPGMSIKEWRSAIGKGGDNLSDLPDRKVFLQFECGFLRHMKSMKPDLPMSVVQDDGECRLVSARTALEAPEEIALALTYLWMASPQLHPVLKPD